MIKILERAIQKVQALPQHQQEYAAFVLEEIAAERGEAQVSDEESRMIQEGIDAADRGDFASPEDVEAVLGRYRL